MSLLQITEPGISATPHLRKLAIGIDLGTTNSLVGVVENEIGVVLDNENGEYLIPSVVHYTKDNVQVGSIALAQRVVDPVNTIVSVKRFIGKSIKDLDLHKNYPYKFNDQGDIVEIETNGGVKNPIQISADILRYLKEIAVKKVGEEPSGAVITVPAYFNESQRHATKQAAQLAGLNVLRLLNEPTAAAIAYGLDTKNEGTFLVYDLGGGTLDVSILKLNNGVFEVIAVNGDANLGGDDFDYHLYHYILEKLHLSGLSDIDIAKILTIAKSIKEQLSIKDEVSFNLILSNKKCIDLPITRTEFDKITTDLLQAAILPVKKALRDAKLNTNDIDNVIMVGGSTRMPSIRNLLSENFKCDILTNIDPDKVVATGAAMQADILIGNRKDDWLLLDVTPLSLGIETMGGIVEKVIPRNSPIPITKAQEFTTYKDGQTAMSIHVVQGERELVSECRSLAKFSLKGIPPMAAGSARVLVTFQIDADGLLSVSATEKTTNTISKTEIKPSFGLTDAQVVDMLKDSVKFAKHDIELRQLAESCVNANAILATVENAIKVDGELLTEIELAKINYTIGELRELLTKDFDINIKNKKVKELTDKLNVVTKDFAAKRMDKVLSKELTGHNIDKII
ncbi:MAG: Fe-S protein assembly chaperone HscA [Neisseriaceae bacterium]